VVKLRYRVVKRKYKHETYFHPECSLNFPVKLHELLRFLWNCSVVLEAKREGDTVLVIICKDPDS